MSLKKKGTDLGNSFSDTEQKCCIKILKLHWNRPVICVYETYPHLPKYIVYLKTMTYFDVYSFDKL